MLETPIQSKTLYKPLFLIMHNFLILIPDKRENRFELYDYRCKKSVLLDILSKKGFVYVKGSAKWVFDNLSWEENSELLMGKVDKIDSAFMKLNGDQFVVNQFRIISNKFDQEKGGFKFPLMLVGIGLAFVYQIFCRDTSALRPKRKIQRGRGYKSRPNRRFR